MFFLSIQKSFKIIHHMKISPFYSKWTYKSSVWSFIDKTVLRNASLLPGGKVVYKCKYVKRMT